VRTASALAGLVLLALCAPAAGEPRRVFQNARAQAGRTADADEICVGDGGDQIRLGQRLGVGFNVAVAVAAQRLDGAWMDSFKQQDFDFAFFKRCSGQFSA